MKLGARKNVHLLKINKQGVLIRSGGLENSRKINRVGGDFIWYLRVYFSCYRRCT